MKSVLYKLGADPQYRVDVEKSQLSFPVRVKLHKEEKKWKKSICFLTDMGTVEQPHVEINFFGENLTKEEQNWLLSHLTKRFQWDSSLLPNFYTFVGEATPIGEVVKRYQGLPLVLDEGIYEGLIKTIVHQQVNLRFAHQLVLSLAKDYGESLKVEEHEYYFLPTSSQLARVEVSELRTKKFSQKKAEYITDIAKKISKGELDLEALSLLSNDDFIERLTQERGIGIWTAECILLFSLGRANLFPAGDLAIRNAIKIIEGLPERPSIDEGKEWGKPYEPWGSYLAIYLWESLGNNKIKIE
jgi:DNA-3-methyladenine glycosylase II